MITRRGFLGSAAALPVAALAVAGGTAAKDILAPVVTKAAKTVTTAHSRALWSGIGPWWGPAHDASSRSVAARD